MRNAMTLLLVTACAPGEPSAPVDETPDRDVPTTYAGTSSALYLTMDVPPFDDVEETVTAVFDGDAVHLPFALCDVVGTATTAPSSDRVFVELDLDATTCGFDAAGTAVDVAIEDLLVSWDAEELSITVTGQGSAPDVDPFDLTLSFDGVVAP